MNTEPPAHPKQPPATHPNGRPSARSLLRWGVLVLVLHLFLLLSLAGTLDWQLSTPQTLRSGSMQTRSITPPAAVPTASDLNPAPAARTRVAMVEKPKPKLEPIPKPAAPQTAMPPKKPPAGAAVELSPLAERNPASDQVPPQTNGLDTSLPIQMQDHASLADVNDPPQKKELPFTTDPQADTLVVETPAAVPSSAHISANPVPLIDPANTPALAPADAPLPAQTPVPPRDKAGTSETNPDPNQRAVSSVAPAQAVDAAPEHIASATLALPELALASLPPSALLSYRLNGQEKGINYQASGELRWQHNDNAYAMSLSVKAFLLGSRHWRSVGQINATGLAPTRFSDSWRSERAAHFDRPNQRIVFSSNAPTAPLQPGAQDQVSLYVQLAAAMAQSGQQMVPGTRLQIQTATVRDALPWLLTLEKLETLQIDGQSLQAVKWVCQPRNRFDAQVEFWVTAAHDWLPARIRITQVSGSFIDLQLSGRVTLGDLPPVQ